VNGGTKEQQGDDGADQDVGPACVEQMDPASGVALASYYQP